MTAPRTHHLKSAQKDVQEVRGTASTFFKIRDWDFHRNKGGLCPKIPLGGCRIWVLGFLGLLQKSLSCSGFPFQLGKEQFGVKALK